MAAGVGKQNETLKALENTEVPTITGDKTSTASKDTYRPEFPYSPGEKSNFQASQESQHLSCKKSAQQRKRGSGSTLQVPSSLPIPSGHKVFSDEIRKLTGKHTGDSPLHVADHVASARP